MGVRRPWVAGSFYPGDPEGLRRSIEECFRHRLGPGALPGRGVGHRRIAALISPHAGYIYSGPAAAHGYYQLALDGKPSTFIILGPNHTGLGSPVAMMSEGAWETPLGVVEIDGELAQAIFKASDIIDIDEIAHLREHSIEVQLPFLQYLYGSEFRFVPICMGLQDLETSRAVGRAIAEASRGRDVVIIASTDFSHYEPQSRAERNDRRVIEAILNLDEEEVQRTVRRYGVSMCGYGPVSAAITAAKELGASSAELLAYHTSGDVTGDYSAVVGYASIKLTR